MAQITLRDYLQETEDAITSGRIDDALTRCQYVLTHFPDSLEAQRLLGEVYLAQGDLENAQQMFDWILMNDPENVITYCNRALISERLSDFETALDCYQQAYELSRGNSQIRRQFNELGAKTGQPTFMFSRAGLARLYLWGDLFSQAIQEWEAVLSVNPDRLDAQLGLLETCWHEGLYDQVEQLARQILLDVPGCLKALLLLAAVTAEGNPQEAQELLQRAEALDPELVIAQELFADMIASPSTHPFIKLLKKPPVLLETPSEAVVAPVKEPVVALQPSAQSSLSPNAIAHWNDLNEWNGVDTPVKPRQNTQPAPTAFPGWPSEKADDHGVQSVLEQQAATQQDNEAAALDPWALLERSVHVEHQEDYQPEVQQLSQEPAEANVAQREDEETVAWEPEDRIAEEEPDSADAWGADAENNGAFATNAWTLTTKENYASVAPDWLSMLTQDQIEQSEDAPPVLEMSSQEQEPSGGHPAAPEEMELEPMFYAQSAKNAGLQVTADADDDEESLFFGPDWLKSLGAATIDDSPEADGAVSTVPSSPVFAEPGPQSKEVFSPWTLQAPEPEPQSTAHSHFHAIQQGPEPDSQSQRPAESNPAAMQVPEPLPQKVQNAPVPQVPAEAEQSFLKTLENLEHDLRTQGYVPLEPNSFLGKDQEGVSHDEEEKQEEPTLSSALAQLGNFAPPVAPTLAPPVAAMPSIPRPEPAIQPVEPLWLASLGASSIAASQPAASPVPLAEPMMLSDQNNAPMSQVQGLPPAPLAPLPVVQESPAVPPAPILEPVVAPVRVDALPGPIFQPKPQSTRPDSPSPQPVKVSVARGDAILEDELEMTMKRPAIRIPATQQRTVTGRQEVTAQPGRGYAGERPASAANKPADTGGSYKERLLKGYQHQLVGDYDEAMQEYRIIIRNTPELLGEVVSNVRALLKLAPKYSAGYRVLGDAYMRQGEYLQAMEAYNKALTMAKKAKA